MTAHHHTRAAELTPRVNRGIDIDAYSLTLPLDHDRAAVIHGSATELVELAARIQQAVGEEARRIARVNAGEEH